MAVKLEAKDAKRLNTRVFRAPLSGSESDLRSESGQSLMEFAMLLPMLVGMTVIFIRINTAIQISPCESAVCSWRSPFHGL